MAEDSLNYGQIMQRALRRFVTDVLCIVAENGLPGAHHFYITFETSHPGVDMPEHLRQRYPDKMTIVLQDWFEDLAVAGDRFSVTLSFDGAAERLVVPLNSIVTFVDPSVEFGLRFDGQEDGDEEAGLAPETEGDPDHDPDPAGPPDKFPKAPNGLSGDVVPLDRFRRH